MRVSIIMASYNRGHLLLRSLACYLKQAHRDFEVIVVDDDSNDQTPWIVWDAARQGLDIKYVRLVKPAGLWRDGASIINFALRAADGDLIIQTHPEVMPGFDSLAVLADLAGERLEASGNGRGASGYFACKPYYLTVRQQELLDTVDWRNEGPVAVRALPDFYGQARSAEFRGDPMYLPESIEQARTWESFVFGGLTRKGWRSLGGIPSSAQWGTVDVAMLHARQSRGIPTFTPDAPGTYCVHQNHDSPNDVATPRDMNACMAAVKTQWQDNIRW